MKSIFLKIYAVYIAVYIMKITSWKITFDHVVTKKNFWGCVVCRNRKQQMRWLTLYIKVSSVSMHMTITQRKGVSFLFLMNVFPYLHCLLANNILSLLWFTRTKYICMNRWKIITLLINAGDTMRRICTHGATKYWI